MKILPDGSFRESTIEEKLEIFQTYLIQKNSIEPVVVYNPLRKNVSHHRLQQTPKQIKILEPKIEDIYQILQNSPVVQERARELRIAM